MLRLQVYDNVICFFVYFWLNALFPGRIYRNKVENELSTHKKAQSTEYIYNFTLIRAYFQYDI